MAKIGPDQGLPSQDFEPLANLVSDWATQCLKGQEVQRRREGSGKGDPEEGGAS